MINNLPIRLDYYQYCAETWREIFLSFNLQKIRSIIDLCPGWSPKIELALLQTKFDGTIIAIDKSQEALDCFHTLIDPFPKKFQVRVVKANILDNSPNFDRKTDMVVANHIFDDLLIDYFLGKQGKTNINVFQDRKYFEEIWEDILKEKNIEEIIFDKLKDLFLQLVNKNGYFIVAQYFGYQEKLYNLEKAYYLCRKIMKRVVSEFTRKEISYLRPMLIKNAFLKMKNPYFPEDDVICLQKQV